jgi:hypothetical protein
MDCKMEALERTLTWVTVIFAQLPIEVCRVEVECFDLPVVARSKREDQAKA